MLSTNFCMISYRNALLNKEIFINRMRIYFYKRAKCEKKRLVELLPIFFKIIQEEFEEPERSKMLYERELMNSFKDTKVEGD